MNAIRALVDSIANPALWENVLLPIIIVILTIWALICIMHLVSVEMTKRQVRQLQRSKELAKQRAYRYISSNNANTKSRLELTKLQERGY